MIDVITKKVVCLVDLIFSSFYGPCFSEAAGMPQGWPWHGVSIGFPEGKPTDIERYKMELGINSVRLQLMLRRYAQHEHVSIEKSWQDFPKIQVFFD